jgi:hypothetical protein
MRWKVKCMNGNTYRSSYYMEEGSRLSLEKGLRCPIPWAPAKSVCTCPRHKKNQLCAMYVRWTRKLSLLSLIEAVNTDVYQQ